MSAHTAALKSPDAIASALRSSISDGTFAPGDRLVQEELAERFGVSRIPLREAMRTLAGEGLLTTQPGGGTFVTSLNLDEIDEIYDLRRLIEPSFAEHVIERISRAEIRKLDELVQAMDDVDAVGTDQWSRTNFEFHLAMYRIAALPLRFETLSRLYHQLEPFSRYYVHGTHAIDVVQHEHHSMMSALVAGDAAELEKQIIAHIDGGQAGLRAAWSTAAQTTSTTGTR